MMKIIIAGDLSPQGRVKTLFDAKQYDEVFKDVKTLVSSADYSIVNLETAIVDEIQKYRPALKWSPNLYSNTNVIDAVKYVGFQCMTLANNHFRDYGNDSVSLALDILKRESIDYVGGGNNIEDAQKILYKLIDGKRIAIINFCEHEQSIADEKNGGCAPLDVVTNYYQIQQARDNADFVVVIVHGGHEHYQLPSPRMQKTYRFFIDAGADIVINHHQHCYSGYEEYHGKYIFYGLGNFCFDNNSEFLTPWNYGALLQLEIGDFVSFRLIPYKQCSANPSVELLKDEELGDFKRRVSELNSVIADEGNLKLHHKEYCARRFSDMRMCLSPYTNHYLFSLALRRLLPSFNSRKRLLKALDYIECESHRDVFVEYLKNSIE